MRSRIIWIFIIIGIACSCSSSSDVRRKIPNDNQYQKTSFNPSLYLYHNSETSSILFFKIDPAELLFTRINPESPFKSNLEIEVLLFETVKEINSFVDTIKVNRSYVNRDVSSMDIFGEITLPLEGDKDYFLEIYCYDVNKKSGKRFDLLVPKSSLTHRMNFLVTDASTNQPIFDFHKIGDGKVLIENNRNQGKDILIHEIDLSIVKFPPPPFASRQVFLPELPKETIETNFFKENHAYFITTDLEKKEGITIAVRNRFFPEVKTFEQMSLPTRYITTKSEYEELVSGVHTKKSLDDFWIKCGGSTERGKQLIRVYYTRVSLANRYFSTINPGWKTDRGAIYIIYGKPNQVQNRNNQETWVYGDITNPNSLSFTFTKTENLYSDNQYELQRNSGYRIHWQRAVTNWINGRVYERK